MVAPAEPILVILRLPGCPFERNGVGFVVLFIAVLPDSKEKWALYGCPLIFKVPSGL